MSIAETEYAPCACSPLGKVKRVSIPTRRARRRCEVLANRLIPRELRSESDAEGGQTDLPTPEPAAPAGQIRQSPSAAGERGLAGVWEPNPVGGCV